MVLQRGLFLLLLTLASVSGMFLKNFLPDCCFRRDDNSAESNARVMSAQPLLPGVNGTERTNDPASSCSCASHAARSTSRGAVPAAIDAESEKIAEMIADRAAEKFAEKLEKFASQIAQKVQEKLATSSENLADNLDNLAGKLVTTLVSDEVGLVSTASAASAPVPTPEKPGMRHEFFPICSATIFPHFLLDVDL